jgi:Icc protein
MTKNRVITVAQISDLHVADVAGAKGFVARDSDTTLRGVLQAVRRGPKPDVVVASGDLADTGGASAYLRLSQMLAELEAPVYCFAGNHDRAAALEANLSGGDIHVEGSTRLGEWLFLFLDSNAHGQTLGDDGVWRDRPDRFIAAERGGITPAEEHRARSILTETQCEHVLLWVHHPPIAAPGGKPPDADYTTLIHRLLHDSPKIRAVACGHKHNAFSGELDGRPVYASPSTSYNVDLATCTFDAPGYRCFEIHPDGRIESRVELLTDQFPDEVGRPLPPVLAELQLGRVTVEQLRAMSDEQFEARFGIPRPKR